MAAIAAVLSSYDTELIREVTDPRTGIAATEKFMSFMPNAGELKVYCDGVAAVRARIQRLGALPAPDFSRSRLPPPPPTPGDLATVFVPDSNVRYPQLVEWAKTADRRLWKYDGRAGICVSFDTWDQRAVGARKLADATESIIGRATAFVADEAPPAFDLEPGAINSLTHELVPDWDVDQPAHPPQHEAASEAAE